MANGEARVTVRQAAKELELSVLTVETMMQRDMLPIGFAFRRDEKSRYRYYIYRGLLDREKERLGIKDDGAQAEGSEE